MAKSSSSRSAEVSRQTKETRVKVSLNLDGAGKSSPETGVGFLNHMLDLFARHGLIDLTVNAEGDLDVDAHHTVEDVGIVLGQALSANAPTAGSGPTSGRTYALNASLMSFPFTI